MFLKVFSHDIYDSRQVIHTVLLQMKDLDFASVAGQCEPQLVLIIVHRFQGLVEWHDTGIR